MISSFVRPVAEREFPNASIRFVCFSLAESNASDIVSTDEATSSVASPTASPVVEEITPKEDKTLTNLNTCSLDVSEIYPH